MLFIFAARNTTNQEAGQVSIFNDNVTGDSQKKRTPLSHERTLKSFHGDCNPCSRAEMEFSTSTFHPVLKTTLLRKGLTSKVANLLGVWSRYTVIITEN